MDNISCSVTEYFVCRFDILWLKSIMASPFWVITVLSCLVGTSVYISNSSLYKGCAKINFFRNCSFNFQKPADAQHSNNISLVSFFNFLHSATKSVNRLAKYRVQTPLLNVLGQPGSILRLLKNYIVFTFLGGSITNIADTFSSWALIRSRVSR